MAGLLLTLIPAPATGQSIRGQATEKETGEPVAGARVMLLHGTGRTAAAARTDDDGQFVIGAPGTGAFLLKASSAGFIEMQPIPVRIETQEEVVITLVLSRQVIPLDPVIVIVRRYDHRHDATWRGVLARRDIYGRLGNQRVYMRGDIEMRNSTSVVEVARGVPPPLRATGRALSIMPPETSDRHRADGPRRTRPGCTIVFLEGRLVATQEEAAWVLDTPPPHLAAVEVYRTWRDAPLGLRSLPAYASARPGLCSVVALWLR